MSSKKEKAQEASTTNIVRVCLCPLPLSLDFGIAFKLYQLCQFTIKREVTHHNYSTHHTATETYSDGRTLACLTSTSPSITICSVTLNLSPSTQNLLL